MLEIERDEVGKNDRPPGESARRVDRDTSLFTLDASGRQRSTWKSASLRDCRGRERPRRE